MRKTLVSIPTPSIATALSLIAAIAVGMIAYHFAFSDANADSHDSAGEVRVSARALEDGRVEVALRQLDGGVPAERILPDARFLRADAEAGTWFDSSDVALAAVADDNASGPLFCIAAHGTWDDSFWRYVRGYSRQAAIDAGLNVRFSHSLDGAQQAAAIGQCSADGAAVIASTLADPDAVRAALDAAKQAGARIVTFNSGAEDAASVGSELHIALNETAAGRLVGKEFNSRAVTGTVGCLLHEADNVGLEARCDALADAYSGGEVIRVTLPEGESEAVVSQAVSDRLTDPDQPTLRALVALNADTLVAALLGIIATADQLEQDVQIAGIGQSTGLNRIDIEHRRRHLAFVTNSAAEAQGYLITAALQMVYTYPTSPKFISSPTILTATPFLYNSGAIRADAQELAETFRRLQQRLALGDEYDE